MSAQADALILRPQPEVITPVEFLRVINLLQSLTELSIEVTTLVDLPEAKPIAQVRAVATAEVSLNPQEEAAVVKKEEINKSFK